MSGLSYREAVRDALAEEMERDPTVVLLGEDVGLGGVFNVTPGLLERFGPDRVIDTPISEMGFVSAAFGAAVLGMRPVVEIMFADFLGLAMDSLVNQAAKYWYMTNGQRSVPLVIRTAVGAGARFGACHSQTPTAWLLSEPGLKLVAPATVADAKALTKAAIRDENPVVVFEHKLLYGRRAEGADHVDSIDAPIGRAIVRREGEDATIVAALACVEKALEAAEQLRGVGIEVEVIDLRSLRPLDIGTILESVSKTQRLVVVEEGPPIGGYAAEVVAAAAENLGTLAARRVTMPDAPIPFSRTLEDAIVPGTPKIAAAVGMLLGQSPVEPGEAA
jgi:pyruvate/2-oxoglutarate/acetoin dehydrogenase E1 component